MKQLSSKEILEILENNYDVSSYAYNEFLETKGDFDIPDYSHLDDVRNKFFKDKQIGNIPWSERENHLDFIEYMKMPSSYTEQAKWLLNHLGLGKVVEVDRYGGEGQGDLWYTVKHFVDHDVYIKTTGFYQSYSGTDFYDGMGHEVKPQTKTITIFE